MKSENELLLEKFRQWLILKRYASSTTDSYIKSATGYLKWLEHQEVEVNDISYNDLTVYIQQLRENGLKLISVQKLVAVLVKFYNCLIQDGYCADNPASNIVIKGIKRKHLREILTLDELEHLYRSYPTEISAETIKKAKGVNHVPPQEMQQLARRRNKIMLGLMVYQGVRAGELGKLKLDDLQLREGKIRVLGNLRTASRVMKLESFQVYDMMDYIQTTRKAILSQSANSKDLLFPTLRGSVNTHNMHSCLLIHLQVIRPGLKNLQQIRSSVIVNWLKSHNLRRVQYFAGHRYVSSKESKGLMMLMGYGMNWSGFILLDEFVFSVWERTMVDKVGFPSV